MKPAELVIGLAVAAAAATTSELAIENANLTSLIMHGAIPYSQEVFSHALNIIDKLDGAASCHRLATARVIGSCRSVEPQGPDHARILDEVKSVYAARLALCELRDAHVAIPKECEHILPSEELHQDHPKSSRACLRSLESRSQWWTSYSNARQNAVIICQAARSELEKDDTLNTHRKLVKNVADMTRSLSENLDDSDARLQAQKRFIEVASRLEEQFLNNVHESQNSLQKSIASIVSNVESRLQNFLFETYKGADAVASKIQGINNDMDKSSEHAVSLGNSVQYLAQNQLGALTAKVEDIHNALQASSTLLGLMLSRQNFLDERMNFVLESFKNLEASARNVVETQTLFAEEQTQLFDTLQARMNYTSSSINHVELRMNKLASVIEEKTLAAQAIDVSGWFGAIIRELISWARWPLIASMLAFALFCFALPVAIRIATRRLFRTKRGCPEQKNALCEA